MTSVAILGSAFDPPHYAHAAMACLALTESAIDEVWLCPSPDRWDKTPTAPAALRLQWTAMLAQELSQHGFRTRLCSDELEFTAYRGSTYFLRWLARRYPGHRFSLLLGADAWSSIPSWRDPVAGEMNGLELLRSVPLLVVPRPGTELECISPDKTQLIHPALPPEEQAAHRLLPTLGSYADAFALIAGEAVELELLSSRGIRNEIIDEKIGRSFCFPALEEQVRKSRTYLSR